MTTIAWDGKTLAGDRGTWHGYYLETGRKVYRIRRPDGKVWLVGFAGDAGLAMATLAWLRGKGPEPQIADKKEADDLAIVIDDRRRVFRLTKFLTYYRIYDKRCGFGGGQDIAVAAMLAGADAVMAVRIVARVGSMSARGVDRVRL